MPENLSETIADTVGTYIGVLRKQRKSSLRKLASLMGYSDHTYLYEVEKGIRPPSDDLIERLISALDLSGEECEQLLSLAGKTRKKNLKPVELDLINLLEETGIVVGAYTGKLSEGTVGLLIERIKKWRDDVGI